MHYCCILVAILNGAREREPFHCALVPSIIEMINEGKPFLAKPLLPL